jgi:hypothetical protein
VPSKKSTEPKSPGRPSKLTPDIAAEIITIVELGVSPRPAALKARVPEGTFDSWQRQARAGKEPYRAFFMDLTCARASGMVSLHIRAIGGGPGSGGAQWALERRFPEEYGLRSKVELSEDPEKPVGGIRAALEGMTMAQLDLLAAGGKAARRK